MTMVSGGSALQEVDTGGPIGEGSSSVVISPTVSAVAPAFGENGQNKVDNGEAGNDNAKNTESSNGNYPPYE